MDLHGTLSVDSAPGRGTRVIIDIPVGGPSMPLTHSRERT
jgi:hypothetical protein